MNHKIVVIGLFLSVFGFTQFSNAMSETHSIGGGLILMSPVQEDLDTHIGLSNAANGTAKNKFGSAYEAFIHYTYRFSGTMFALQFRPSYFTHTASSDYSLSGFTMFPIFRLYPLENNFIHFFLQAGVGYGRMTGKINQTAASVEFAGGAFGALAGLGANFCFTDSHCIGVEGNLRYLPIERNIASSVSGTPTQFNPAPSADSEVEINNFDMKTTMSGIQGVLSYNFMF